jgi:hypothetical protein
LIFKVKGQGHRVKFVGEGIHHALPLFSLDLVSMIYKQDFSTLELPWSEYLNQKYKYQSLQNHICLKLPVFVVICLKNLDNFTKTCMILTQTITVSY